MGIGILGSIFGKICLKLCISLGLVKSSEQISNQDLNHQFIKKKLRKKVIYIWGRGLKDLYIFRFSGGNIQHIIENIQNTILIYQYGTNIIL